MGNLVLHPSQTILVPLHRPEMIDGTLGYLGAKPDSAGVAPQCALDTLTRQMLLPLFSFIDNSSAQISSIWLAFLNHFTVIILSSLTLRIYKSFSVSPGWEKVRIHVCSFVCWNVYAFHLIFIKRASNRQMPKKEHPCVLHFEATEFFKLLFGKFSSTIWHYRKK